MRAMRLRPPPTPPHPTHTAFSLQMTPMVRTDIILP